MSYSTMLYAMDIGALKSAFGSKDHALLTRVRTAIQEGQGTDKPEDPENEEDRKYFLQLLEQAVAQNRGVVGFYH